MGKKSFKKSTLEPRKFELFWLKLKFSLAGIFFLAGFNFLLAGINYFKRQKWGGNGVKCQKIILAGIRNFVGWNYFFVWI